MGAETRRVRDRNPPPTCARPECRRVEQTRPDEDRRYLDGERGGVCLDQDEGRRTDDDFGPSSLVIRRHWAIALGSVGPTPLRAPEAEAALAADTSPEGVRHAAELAAAAARPIDDIRASAAYRRAMVAVLTRRGIELILADLTGLRNLSGLASRRRPFDKLRRRRMNHPIQLAVNGEQYSLQRPRPPHPAPGVARADWS